MRQGRLLAVGLFLVVVAGVGGYWLGRSVPQPGSEREVNNYCEAYARFAEVDASQIVTGVDRFYYTDDFEDAEWRYAIAQVLGYSRPQVYVQKPGAVDLPDDQSKALSAMSVGDSGSDLTETILAIARDGLARCGVKLSTVGPLASYWIDVDARGLPEFERPD